MRWLGVIVLSALLLGVFTIGGVYFYRPRIERDLLARVSTQLADKQLSLEHAKFTGRDGVFKVEKSAHTATEVRTLIESVFGVRVAKVEEIVKEPPQEIVAEPVKEDPSLFVQRIGSHVRLGGKFLEKEAVDEFSSQASEVFGGNQVQSSLTQSAETLPGPYLTELKKFILFLKRIGPESTLILKDRVVTLGGVVPDVSVKEDVEKLARQQLPAGLHFESQLVVPLRDTSAMVARGPDLVELLDAVRLHFNFNSTLLTPETASNLELLRQALQEHQDGRIRILGYTDSIGSKKYNYQLSRRRADAIRKQLCRTGFAKSRFEIEGRGEDEAVADNSTLEGRQLNRRVAFILSGGK